MFCQVAINGYKIVTMIKIRLRELMWEKDISAVEIQKQTEIHATTISKIINGKHSNFRLDTVDKLCEILDCRIQDLLTDERKNK